MKKHHKKPTKKRLSLSDLLILQSAFNTFFEEINFEEPTNQDKALQAVVFNLHNRAVMLSARPCYNGFNFKLTPVELYTIFYIRNDLKVMLEPTTEKAVGDLLEINKKKQKRNRLW
ncbi:MAG: hypothetical protein V4538_02435 [Bacteroidota bacterium]